MSLSEPLATSDSHGEKAVERQSVYVYEAPVRLWHWINAFAILTLALTGYFIGSPLQSMPGEASAHFLMGYIRFTHFAANSGAILLIYEGFTACCVPAGNFQPNIRRSV